MPGQPYVLEFDSAHATELAAAFQRAHSKLTAALAGMADTGQVHEPWLGDPVSHHVASHFNEVAVLGQSSGLNVFLRYRDELQKIIEQLRASAADYTDSDATAGHLMPRM